ncbi:MAG TPA: CotH kinase family protein [Myxococcota bacterium]|nr:CotH kinase family protein [Myxococcota bacterium]
MVYALLLAACRSPGPVLLEVGESSPGKDSQREDSEIDEIPGSDSDPADSDRPDTEPPAPTWPQACDDIYDPDQLQEFDLTFTPADWRGLQSDCQNGVQQYRPVSFGYDGQSYDAMVRLKGNWSWNCDKMQFVISFNEADPDARFRGLRKVMLDAPWYDWTLLHERLAFALFERRGLAYSCANSARLNIDGAYYGLYTNVERIDREYLERNFEDPTGNLYQGGSELKTNEDVGDTQSLVALQNASTVAEIDALVDLDQAVAEWATEAMIPAMDNYWAGVEINYYLYDAPGQGFVYLPYDMDLSFGDSRYGDGSLVWPDTLESDPITYEHYGWRKEELVKRVLGNEAWCNRFVEELQKSRDAFVPAELQAQVESWDSQIHDALDADPRKSFSTRGHDQAVAELKQFMEDRAAFVDAWLAQGGHCPARW